MRDKNITVVSPDVGGVVRARALAKRLEDAPLAIVDKRREKAGVSEVMNIIGDVKDRFCILIDDIADSAGTLVQRRRCLEGRRRIGCRRLYHPWRAFGRSGQPRQCVVACANWSSPIRYWPPTPRTTARRSASFRSRRLLGEAIKRIADESSVSSLFD